MIDHLPRASAYMQAMVEDEELAEQIADEPDSKTLPTRQMRDWTPVVELLSVIADRIAENTQVVAATAGAKPHRIEPMPRPGSALERVREHKRRTHHRKVVAMVLPHRAEALAAEQAAEDARRAQARAGKK